MTGPKIHPMDSGDHADLADRAFAMRAAAGCLHPRQMCKQVIGVCSCQCKVCRSVRAEEEKDR